MAMPETFSKNEDSLENKLNYSNSLPREAKTRYSLKKELENKVAGFQRQRTTPTLQPPTIKMVRERETCWKEMWGRDLTKLNNY